MKPFFIAIILFSIFCNCHASDYDKAVKQQSLYFKTGTVNYLFEGEYNFGIGYERVLPFKLVNKAFINTEYMLVDYTPSVRSHNYLLVFGGRHYFKKSKENNFNFYAGLHGFTGLRHLTYPENRFAYGVGANGGAEYRFNKISLFSEIQGHYDIGEATFYPSLSVGLKYNF